MDELEQKIRRSSRIKDSSLYREFLSYASLVRDEDQVYVYMEENKIGIQEPEFWAAKLKILKNKCQYSQFIKVIKKLNRNYELKKHPKYWLITQIQNQLQRYLEKMLRKKVKGKRSAKQYQTLNFGIVQKQTRKFGKVEVYVDPDCRLQYRLQDLAQFVTKRLKQQCEFERNCYQRQIQSKPLSFIGKAKDKLNKISLQILGYFAKQQRTSNNSKRKTNQRISIVGRKSNKNDLQPVQTPDFKKRSVNRQNKQCRKAKKQNLYKLDSVQILKNIGRKSLASSRKKSQSQNPQFDVNSDISSVKKQKIRNSPDKQNQNHDDIFTEPDRSRQVQFSFRDEIKNFSTEEKKSNKRHSRQREDNQVRFKKSQSQKQLGNKNDNQKDFAFIQQSQTMNNSLNCNKNTKQSADLQNVIKQIQMQRYQSQTLSEIDSNKQNNFLLSSQQLGAANPNQDQTQIQKEENQRKRTKFETIKKDKQYYRQGKKQNKKKLQKEADHDSVDDSSQAVYKQLLAYLETEEVEKQCKRFSMSERENKKNKRFSRISQQKSYSFSETRPKSRSDNNS